jgi:hypothetical protein
LSSISDFLLVGRPVAGLAALIFGLVGPKWTARECTDGFIMRHRDL